jgi:putative MATE family efflux protein
MMIFTSIYGVVDGLFVSNFAGKTAFTAVNLIMPYLMVFGTLGFMLGTGGTALISMTLGMGDRKKANSLFSMLTYVCIIGGVLLTVVSILFMRSAAELLGATGQMLEDCVSYGTIVQLALPAYVLQFAFQSYCVAAEKPGLSLGMTVVSGICNMLLDGLFVGLFNWGLVGAATATGISQVLGGIIPLIYFARPNPSLLRLGKCKMDLRALLRTCANGSSELMSNLSMSLVSMIYNFQLMRYAGDDGIAAYGVLMYVNFVFISVYIGFSVGSAPLVGYHHGAANHQELKNLLRKGISILAILAVAMTAAGELLAVPLSKVFVGYDQELLDMTVRGFRIYTLSFLLCGFNIYGSAFFTALNNGLISAVISFMRTLICQIAAVFLLPLLLGLDGIWWSILAAEVMALTLTGVFMIVFRKKYHYG